MSLRTSLVAAVAMTFVAATAVHAQDAADARSEPDMANGAEQFQLCAQCHGADGHGNRDYLAPAIAGLSLWYVEMQLGEFKTGLRGLHFDDISGMRMRPMAMTLRSEKDSKDVAAYVASLPKADPQLTIEGDAEAGKALYVLCAACHGPNGDGIEPMKAPALNHIDDWYLVHQLDKFKTGVRGTRPGDPYGVLMGPNSPMAMTLKTDQSVRDVVAYIMTLDSSQ